MNKIDIKAKFVITIGGEETVLSKEEAEKLFIDLKQALNKTENNYFSPSYPHIKIDGPYDEPYNPLIVTYKYNND